MARKTNRLTAIEVGKLEKRGYYCDGAGLYLQISKSGSKSWIMRYTLAGKPCEMGLGSFVTFTLAEARHRATAQRKLLADGIDPLTTKRSDLLARRMAYQLFHARLAITMLDDNGRKAVDRLVAKARQNPK